MSNARQIDIIVGKNGNVFTFGHKDVVQLHDQLHAGARRLAELLHRSLRRDGGIYKDSGCIIEV